MKRTKVRVASLLLVLSLLLTGCREVRTFFYTESDYKRIAEKALEDKYGEEFVIHSAWSRDSNIFYAICSPESDPDVVFEAQPYKDGSGFFADEYIAGIVAKEIEEKLIGDLEGVFGDCAVNAVIFYNSVIFDSVSIDSAKNMTLEEYLKLDSNAECLVYVIVDETQIKDENIKQEYDYFSQIFLRQMNEKKMPDTAFSLYMADSVMKEQCKEHFKENATFSGSFRDSVNEYYNWGFGYPDGSINKTYEEYEELRMETKDNE